MFETKKMFMKIFATKLGQQQQQLLLQQKKICNNELEKQNTFLYRQKTFIKQNLLKLFKTGSTTMKKQIM